MKKSLLFIASFIVISLSLLILSGLPVSASWNQNNIIGDNVFDNTGSMDTGSIQNFLNSFPNSCLKDYQAPYPNTYNDYGGNVSAAVIIRRAADFYSVNPQVILSTLEKEESLVSGDVGCADWRYNSAMGMGCPDGGVCPAPGYEGFSRQVTKGTWLLKFGKERANGNVEWNANDGIGGDRELNYSGPMTQGCKKRKYDAQIICFDGYTTIDGQSVHIDSGATGSFYNYTPHFHGNQNFVSIFEKWFGSTWQEPILEDLSRKAGEGGGNTASQGPTRLDLSIQGTNNTGANTYTKSFDTYSGWSDYIQDSSNSGSKRVSSQIASTSWAPGRIDIFARSENGTLVHKWYIQYVGWSDWEDLGGCMIGAPTVTSWESGRLDIFVQGCNSSGINMYHKWYDGVWRNWEVVPNMNARISSAPSATSWAPGRIDIFARSENAGLIHNWYDGQWHNTESLGGCIVSQPAVAAWSPNRLDIFVKGCNSTGANVYHKVYDTNHWAAWELNPNSQGTRASSILGAISWSNNRIDIFTRGEDATLMHQWWSGSWSDWESLGGSLASS